jgi:peptidyl-prolyl cis-trans isomerase C
MRLLIVLLVAATALGLAQADLVVATVGQSSITKGQFDLQFRLFVRDTLQNQGMPFSEEAMATFNDYKPQFLDRLARDRAIINAAEKAGFAAKPEDIDKAIGEVQGQFEKAEDFEKALQEAGIPSTEAYKGLVYEALTYNAFVQDLSGKIKSSEPAMKVLYYLSRSQVTNPQRYCSAHILLKTAKEANEIIAKLAKGEKFEDLAKQFSQDPGSKEGGGDLGCEPRGTFVAPFERALIGLQPGETSKLPVQTDFGFHVIYLIKIEPPSLIPFEDVKGKIEDGIRESALQKVLDSIVGRAAIELFPDKLN